MTEFSDVNVGDKVRLTHKDGATVAAIVASAAQWTTHGWKLKIDALCHALYANDGWSVEVLEPAPKPLPTTPGLYYVPARIGLWRFDGFVWKTDLSGSWVELGGTSNVPRDLVRLVSVSAVEEARAEVVKEIVAMLRKKAYFLSADIIESEFGGKS